MHIYDLNKWEEFEFKINEIKSRYGYYVIEQIKLYNRILYRGQSNSEWGLKTTLERYTNQEYTIENYLLKTLECAPEIESFIGKSFNLPAQKNIIDDINDKSKEFWLHIPVYDYWIYLRQHGFPSPLLDWTFSPYIAAFFAFSEQIESERCSIYIFIEWPQGHKTCSGLEPRINVLGPNVRTHKRHFLQQSWYSIALKKERDIPDVKEYAFQNIISHEEIFRSSSDDQDLIFKITLPISERRKVLDYLNQFNINQFSLFQTVESLMQTLAFKKL
jgi:hypothetical protein